MLVISPKKSMKIDHGIELNDDLLKKIPIAKRETIFTVVTRYFIFSTSFPFMKRSENNKNIQSDISCFSLHFTTHAMSFITEVAMPFGSDERFFRFRRVLFQEFNQLR